MFPHQKYVRYRKIENENGTEIARESGVDGTRWGI